MCGARICRFQGAYELSFQLRDFQIFAEIGYERGKQGKGNDWVMAYRPLFAKPEVLTSGLVSLFGFSSGEAQ